MKIDLNPRNLASAITELERVQSEVLVLEGQVANPPKVEESAPFKALQVQLGEVSAAKKKLDGDLARLQGELTAVQGELTTTKGDLTKAQEAVKDFDGKLATASKDKAIEFLAAKGLTPLDIGLATGQQPNKVKLTGRDRVAAAFEEQLEKKGS